MHENSILAIYIIFELYFTDPVQKASACNCHNEIVEVKQMVSQIDKKITMIFEAVQNLAMKVESKQFNAIVADTGIELPTLPIDSVGALKRFNTQLICSAFHDQMVIYYWLLLLAKHHHLMLSLYYFQILKLKRHEKQGSLRVKVRVLMEQLLTYDVASKYTWTGKTCKHECEYYVYVIVFIIK